MESHAPIDGALMTKVARSSSMALLASMMVLLSSALRRAIERRSENGGAGDGGAYHPGEYGGCGLGGGAPG